MSLATERSNRPLQTAEALRRSRSAHQAALLFNAAAEAYPASVAMQAIHVSLAFRKGSQDVPLAEMSVNLHDDPRKIESIVRLARIKHAQHGVVLSEKREEEFPDIIRSVFRYAVMLLRVEPEILEPYLNFYPGIIADLRREPLERKGKEVDMRRKLMRLAHEEDYE